MGISLCMIVKNEEKNIRNCLESVKGIVSEMIVVDTGSVDRTKEIALSLGATVYEWEWNDDFSDARNESIRHANGDWILVMDADEYIAEGAENLKELCERGQKQVYQVTIENLREQGGYRHQLIRLFKNNVGFSYRHAIHEELYRKDSALTSKEIGYANLVLNHTGYQEAQIVDKDKDNRNIKLLQKELKKRPYDEKLHVYIGNQYLRMGDDEKAMYHYKLALRKKSKTDVLQHVAIKMVWAYYRMKRYKELFSFLNECKKKMPVYTDLYYAHGEILEFFGHDEGAIEQYRTCMELGETPTGYYSKDGVGSLLPLIRLRVLYYKQFNLEEELRIQKILYGVNVHSLNDIIRFLELHEKQYGLSGVNKVLPGFMERLGNNVEAKEKLKVWVEEQNRYTEEGVRERAAALRKQSLYTTLHFLQRKKSVKLLEYYLNTETDMSFEDRLAIAEFLYREGQYERVISLAQQLLLINNEHFRAMNLLLMSAYNLGNREEVRNIARDMLKLMPHDSFFSFFSEKKTAK